MERYSKKCKGMVVRNEGALRETRGQIDVRQGERRGGHKNGNAHLEIGGTTRDMGCTKKFSCTEKHEALSEMEEQREKYGGYLECKNLLELSNATILGTFREDDPLPETGWEEFNNVNCGSCAG